MISVIYGMLILVSLHIVWPLERRMFECLEVEDDDEAARGKLILDSPTTSFHLTARPKTSIPQQYSLLLSQTFDPYLSDK